MKYAVIVSCEICHSVQHRGHYQFLCTSANILRYHLYRVIKKKRPELKGLIKYSVLNIQTSHLAGWKERERERGKE